MRERTIWLKPGQELEYCPYCHSHNIRISEDGSYSSCNDCGDNFIVRHQKAAPPAPRRAMAPEELHWLLRTASQLEEDQMTNDQARGVYGSAKRLGYSEDDARALLDKTFDKATTELNEHWIKTRPPWQAPLDFTAPAPSAKPTPFRRTVTEPIITDPRKKICRVFVKGKYRELFTRDNPTNKDSRWELNNLVDIQETGIIGSKPIEQWIYPDGRPDNWGFRPAS